MSGRAFGRANVIEARRKEPSVRKHRLMVKLAALVSVGIGGISSGFASPGYASTATPVSGYVLAWRQSAPKTLLVAYRARNNSTVAQLKATCEVHAKPTFNMPKPHYYTFAPQVISLPKATSKFTFIASFSLPAKPATIKIERVWVKCS
jgi:hypothetical protein